MKIRFGFVTNSSSSSFLVIIDKRPETIEELQKMMFGEMKMFQYPYGDEAFSTYDMASVVFHDLANQMPLTREEIKEEFNYGYPETMQDLDSHDFVGADRKTDWEAYDREYNIRKEKCLQEFFDQYGDKNIYKFHYGDGDGSFYCTMEHGGIFRLLKHYVISHH